MPTTMVYLNQRALTPAQCRKLWNKRNKGFRSVTERKDREDYDPTATFAEHKAAREEAKKNGK